MATKPMKTLRFPGHEKEYEITDSFARNQISKNVEKLGQLERVQISSSAELMDVRAGTNGTTYSSAGEAVRVQISELAEDIAAEKSDRISSIAAEKSDRIAEISVERARIDSFIALPDGSTTGDAELADIRVGINGEVYDSAGTAVRQQISMVANRVDVNNVSLWEQGQINSDGTNGDNTTRIRTIGYIPENVVYVKTDGKANVRAQLYADDGTFVKVSDLGFTQFFLISDVLAENAQATRIREPLI